MSGDPEQEYFADGMVEEITTALSRIRPVLNTFLRSNRSELVVGNRVVRHHPLPKAAGSASDAPSNLMPPLGRTGRVGSKINYN